MNILTGILSRESNISKDIIFSSCDNSLFELLLTKIGYNPIKPEYIYFAVHKPIAILCNNKLSSYDICKNISIQYHIPLIVIDHKSKDNFVDITKISHIDQDKNTYKIAITDRVSSSWDNIHNTIISINDEKSWKSIINTLSQRIYSI